MKFKKGDRVIVRSSRRGNYNGIALKDFDTVEDEWYPIALCDEVVEGLSTEWVEGEEMPCRRGLNLVRPWREEQQGRGALTERAKKMTKKLFGYEFNKTELRLIPYVCHVALNSQKIEQDRVNDEDREILKQWEESGWIQVKPFVQVTQAVWLKFQQVLWLTYVDRDR